MYSVFYTFLQLWSMFRHICWAEARVHNDPNGCRFLRTAAICEMAIDASICLSYAVQIIIYIYMPLYAIIYLLYATKCRYMPIICQYFWCCPLFLSMVFSLKQRVMKMVSWNRKGLQRRWSPQLNGAINGNTSSASMVNIDRKLWKDPPDLMNFDEKNLSISTGPFSRALYSHYRKVCLWRDFAAIFHYQR